MVSEDVGLQQSFSDGPSSRLLLSPKSLAKEPHMNDRPEPAALQSPLRNSLRQKSRRRRDGLTRMQAAAPPPPSRNDLLPKLTLVKRDITQLKLPSRKLRKVDPVHVQETAQAISSLGFCDPVLIDEDDNVIDGVVRIVAAEAIGLTRIPCLRAAHLTPAERRLLRLALNRLGEKGSWDLDELKVEIEELILEDAPVEITGFEPAELDQILLDDEVALVEEGPLEPPPGAAAVSRLGDLFRLGEHRLLCADAADPAAIARLMRQGEKCLARLILTDPPYNVPIAGNVTKGRHREFVQASGEMTPDEYAALLRFVHQGFSAPPRQRWSVGCVHRLARLSDHPYRSDPGRSCTF